MGDKVFSDPVVTYITLLYLKNEVIKGDRFIKVSQVGLRQLAHVIFSRGMVFPLVD